MSSLVVACGKPKGVRPVTLKTQPAWSMVWEGDGLAVSARPTLHVQENESENSGAEKAPASSQDAASSEHSPARPTHTPTRASLLVAVRDLENAAAWEQFVEIYTPLIYGHCLRRGLQPADASDVTQDTMKALAQALQNFQYDRSKGSFRSWLLTVTRSKLNNHFSKQAKAPHTPGDTSIQTALDAHSAEAGASDTAKWEAEYRARLYNWAADKVRPHFQPVTWDAFLLSTFHHLSAAEVAQKLGISPGAVYIAKCRVAARLKETIQEASDDDDFWD